MMFSRFKNSLILLFRPLVTEIPAVVLGVIIFATSIGFEKLQPNNVAWLTFRDQTTHWLGWRFFADSVWEWPPGLNPKYGWDSATSIIASDSLPLFAIIFKLVDIESVSKGQYFGLAYLLGSICLCIGCSRVLRLFGIQGFQRFLGVSLLVTSPIFWVMNQWYPALSSGMALIVWALYAYFRDVRSFQFSVWAWLILSLLGVLIQFYLFAIVALLCFASFVSTFPADKTKRLAVLSKTSVALGLVGIAMYLAGYFVIPLRRAAAGSDYGEYSVNLFSLVDFNGTSRFIPDLPSLQGQVEPAALGIGFIALFIVLGISQVRSQSLNTIKIWCKKYRWLVVLLAVMTVFSVSHVVSFGGQSITIPLPLLIVKLLSVFRSSVRFIWPLVIILSFVAIVLVSRNVKRATSLFVIAIFLQIIDSGDSFGEVAKRPDGSIPVVQYEVELWKQVPAEYGTIAHHRASNYKGEWAECAYAALLTSRTAECAYLSRAMRLDLMADERELLLLTGKPPLDIIFWFDYQWVGAHLEQLKNLYDNNYHGFAVVPNGNGILFFPECSRFKNCQFLSRYRLSLEVALSRATG